MTRGLSSRGAAWLGLAILSLAWGTSFLFTTVSLEGASPSAIVAGRITIAALTLNAVRVACGLALPRSRGVWARFAVFALTGSVVPFTLISWGQIEVTSGLAGILLTSSPLFTVVFAHFLLPDERATPRNLLGLAVGGVGMILLLDPSSLTAVGDRDQLVRQLAVIGGSVCYALNTTLVRRSASLHPLVYASGVMLVAAPLALLGAWLSDGSPLPTDAEVGLAIVWLGLVPTGLATLVHFRVVAIAGPAFASLTAYFVPVVAVLAGTFLFDEPLRPTALFSLALLASGVAIGQGGPWRRRDTPRVAVATSR